MRRPAFAAAFAVAFAAAACGGGSEDVESIPEEHHPAVVAEARAEFPRALELHQKIFAATCAATNGVCHNAKEYPDLHTPGNLLAAISAPCNADKARADIFDGCEPAPDQLILDDGSWSTPISWVGAEEWNQDSRSTYRRLIVANPPARAIDRAPAKILRRTATIAVLPRHLTVDEKSRIAEIHDVYELDFQSLSSVRGGDPNNNGHLGASDAWALIEPKRPLHSYLLGRLTSEVPGTRMPPTAVPLGEAELLAITCWIETLAESPSALDAIDYDRCASAAELRWSM